MSAENEKAKIEHPVEREGFTDSFLRVFQEMDFLG